MNQNEQKTKAAELDLTQDDLIECILRRKGGTIVDFGVHNRKKTTYNFLPIDPNDPESPHVAHVPNDDHYDRFLDIPESFRTYNPDEDYQPPLSIEEPENDNDYDDDGLDDILTINPEDVSNNWLDQFAQKHLGLGLNKKQGLADLALQQYGIEFDYKTKTAADIARMILVERIAEEKRASENT